MLNCFVSKADGRVIPIIPVCSGDFIDWLHGQPERIKNIAINNNFVAKSGKSCLILDQNGEIEQVLLGLKNKEDFLSFGALPELLPAACYEIAAENFSLNQLEHMAIAWGLGSYQFKQYKDLKDFGAKLLYKDGYNAERINSVVSSTFWVRDLINIPAGDMYPEKLAEIASNLASEFKAELNLITGEELVDNFPAVYAVGKGSDRQPVLIDLRYGDLDAPKIVLVGKGVCFDSGGLQLKPPPNIVLQKKDMTGAAHALGLARMIMEAKLPVNLRVIIPAVENLISGNSIKPGDIIKTRKGLSVEVLNTDAEGRLILADALALASEWQPELILNFATLTGAARIALGPDITALFANTDSLAADIIKNMSSEQEPIWEMPLYQEYLDELKSNVADFKNIVTSEGFGGGAIIAALFLQQFVGNGIQWAHFDMNAYNVVSKPGRPEGGDACCLRGLFKYFNNRFADGCRT